MSSVTNCGRLSVDNGWRSFWMVEIWNGPKNIWWISERKYWNFKYGVRTELTCFWLPLRACTSGVESSQLDFGGLMLKFWEIKFSPLFQIFYIEEISTYFHQNRSGTTPHHSYKLLEGGRNTLARCEVHISNFNIFDPKFIRYFLDRSRFRPSKMSVIPLPHWAGHSL